MSACCVRRKARRRYYNDTPFPAVCDDRLETVKLWMLAEKWSRLAENEALLGAELAVKRAPKTARRLVSCPLPEPPPRPTAVQMGAVVESPAKSFTVDGTLLGEEQKRPTTETDDHSAWQSITSWFIPV